MVHTAAQEFLHRKKAYGWTDQLRAEYNGLSVEAKDELRLAAKSRPRPIGQIIEDLSKHNFSFMLLTIPKEGSDESIERVYTSKDMLEVHSQLMKPANDISLLFRAQHRIIKEKHAAQVVARTLGKDDSQDVHSMRVKIHQYAQAAYHAAGCKGIVPWAKVIRDSTVLDNGENVSVPHKFHGPGVFRPPMLKSAHKLSAEECREVLKKIKDLVFVLHPKQVTVETSTTEVDKVATKQLIAEPSTSQVASCSSQCPLPNISISKPAYRGQQQTITLFQSNFSTGIAQSVENQYTVPNSNTNVANLADTVDMDSVASNHQAKRVRVEELENDKLHNLAQPHSPIDPNLLPLADRIVFRSGSFMSGQMPDMPDLLDELVKSCHN